MSQGHQRTLQLEASLLLGHYKSCPKGFLIQTHHFFPPVNGSYTPSEDSSSQQCQHKQHQALRLPTLFSPHPEQLQPVPGTHLAAHPPVRQHRHLHRHHCVRSTQGTTQIYHKELPSSAHSSTRQVEHSQSLGIPSLRAVSVFPILITSSPKLSAHLKLILLKSINSALYGTGKKKS